MLSELGERGRQGAKMPSRSGEGWQLMPGTTLCWGEEQRLHGSASVMVTIMVEGMLEWVSVTDASRCRQSVSAIGA